MGYKSWRQPGPAFRAGATRRYAAPGRGVVRWVKSAPEADQTPGAHLLSAAGGADPYAIATEGLGRTVSCAETTALTCAATRGALHLLSGKYWS